MSLSGEAGVKFALTEEDSDTGSGTLLQTYSAATAIGDLTVSTTDIVYTVTGSVGTTAFDFNLNSVNNQSGTGYSTTVIRNNSGDFTTAKMLVVYNTHASNGLKFGSSSANNLLTWNSTSDNVTIPAGAAICFTFGTTLTIGSNGQFNLVGSGAATTFEIYILGA